MMAVSLIETLMVALGGAAGAVCRFLLQQSTLFSPKTGNTIACNLIGCLAIGIIWALISRFNLPGWISRLIVAGFLGGFTTFSAFDIVAMTDSSKWREAIVYAAISILGGLALCFLGLRATNAMLGK